MILTNPVFLSGLVLVLLIMIVVIIYNVYQENYHRQQMREQFGFVQEDALLGQQVVSVRDGQVRNQETEKPTLLRTSKVAQVKVEKEENINDSVLPEPSEPVSEVTSSEAEAESEPISEESQKFSVQEVESDSSEPSYFVFEKDENADEESEQEAFFTDDSLIENVQLTEEIEEITQSIADDSSAAAETTYLVDPETFKQHEFANFDRRFDYLMYIGMAQWQEISAIPIFSQTRFYQVLGQTENGVFELVEPIPDKRYRAFVSQQEYRFKN